MIVMNGNWKSMAVAMALAVGAFGCGDDDGDGTTPTEDMGTGGTDMEVPAGGFPGTTPAGLPAYALGEGVSGTMAMTTSAADYSCAGSRTAPAGGADATFTMEIREFRGGTAVEGLCVKFFPDNVVDLGADCDPGSDFVTDASGNISVTAPAGGWYSYRVFPSASDEIVDSFQINELAPADGGTNDGISVAESTLRLIPAVLGVQAATGTTLVAGTAQDCNGEPVYGAIAAIYREDGTFIAEAGGNTSPKYRFFDGDGTPSTAQRWTHVDGLFGGINMPVDAGGENLLVELWGMNDAGELEVIGCETVPAAPDAVAIVNVGPLRADGPTCPGMN
ncbi:MAG: hypothetical protein CMN30_18990 [Sandaracinus sp.]|nr:hypothetical protein [Sandaracinus sp.]